MLFTSTIFSSFNTASQQVFAQPMNSMNLKIIIVMMMIIIMFQVLTANILQKKTNMNVEQVHLKASL